MPTLRIVGESPEFLVAGIGHVISWSEMEGCQVQSGTGRSRPEWSGITPKWMGFDNKLGTILASACALYLDLLLRVWLRISGGLNCCQEFRRGVV